MSAFVGPLKASDAGQFPRASLRHDLPDNLAVSKPLSEITHLADVVGFVKRQEADESGDFPIERRLSFWCRLRQRLGGHASQSARKLLRHVLPSLPDFFDARILVRKRQLRSSGEERAPWSGPLRTQRLEHGPPAGDQMSGDPHQMV